MPYKARLKTGEPRKRPKPNYAVTNAHEYNESLKRRGQLSLYCPDGDLKALFINDAPYQHGVSGQSQTYRALFSRVDAELVAGAIRLF
ncbi:hypothetical protein WL48_13620 [Burkholderia ubonensis]|uniref:hypothetical protein n=1 Tax=Burkholderia ubonensis TaxID=101571 RepID=UPI00075E8E5D|nr:hypothetical protein [Burkholderia ubonensis]KWC37641.1 hypothetical protein WL48_13620 [Burkholderia ubonensis]KWC41556.1 hypothetical protein WL49_15165 [Burkholderia ubonensis]